MVLLVAWLVMAVTATRGQEVQESPQLGRWEQLPLTEVTDAKIEALEFEEGGSAWILSNRSAFYWDGRRFRSPRTVVTNLHTPLIGGFDRPLFVAQRGNGNDGKLFRLVDGDCVFETSYYHDVPHEPPAVYVSRAGQLFHWGNRFLAVQVDGEWQRVEASLDHLLTFVFETEGRIYFYFNQQLYSVDADGAIEHLEINCPLFDERGGDRFHAVLWGDSRMLILQVGTNEPYAYELTTGQSVNLESLNASLEETRVHDLFRDRDGAVWLSTNDWAKRRFVFMRMDPQGEVKLVEETGALWWRNLRLWSHPGSIRNASDGSIWFGSRYQGVGRYRDGAMQTWGWRHGVSGDIRFLAEGLKGRLYAASEKAVYRFHPDQPADPTPRWVSQWKELPLDFTAPRKDGAGDVWWTQHDQPTLLLKWNGRAWEQRQVPFEVRRASRWMTDDQGHLLLAMNSYPDGCYDVGPDSAEHIRNLYETLEEALRRGATRFTADRTFLGCVRTPDGELWFGYKGQHSVQVFDGRRWSEMNLGEPISFVYESAQHGVIVRSKSGEFLTYDRGQLATLPVSLEQPSRWLLGERSFQPFEEELLDRRPGEFVAVERGHDRVWYLLAPSLDSENTGKPRVWLRTAQLPENLFDVDTGRHGHWVRFPKTPLRRILGDTVVEADLRDSPLASRSNEIQETFEDRRGNLWFMLKLASGYTQTFVKSVDTWRLHVDATATRNPTEVTLRATTTLAGEPEPAAYLFWRVEGGTWRRSESADAVTLEFPKSGIYSVELVAMDRMGALTPDPVTVQVKAPLRAR